MSIRGLREALWNLVRDVTADTLAAWVELPLWLRGLLLLVPGVVVLVLLDLGMGGAGWGWCW